MVLDPYGARDAVLSRKCGHGTDQLGAGCSWLHSADQAVRAFLCLTVFALHLLSRMIYYILFAHCIDDILLNENRQTALQQQTITAFPTFRLHYTSWSSLLNVLWHLLSDNQPCTKGVWFSSARWRIYT